MMQETAAVAAVGRPQQEDPPAATAVDLSQAVEELTARRKTMVLRQQADFVEEIRRITANGNANGAVNVGK